LIVELDGGQHAIRKDADAKRSAFLASRGFRVLRFWDHEVLTLTSAVLEVIKAQLETRGPPSPCPLPPIRGRGSCVRGRGS
jgi:very-short-patch-repair endonuclease